MTKKKHPPAYPVELRGRGIWLFRQNCANYASDTSAYKAIGAKLGCSPDSLRVWCQQAEGDGAQRAGLTTAEKDRIKDLEQENKELRQANEILKKASAYFAQAERDRPFRKGLLSLKSIETLLVSGQPAKFCRLHHQYSTLAGQLIVTQIWHQIVQSETS